MLLLLEQIGDRRVMGGPDERSLGLTELLDPPIVLLDQTALFGNRGTT
jgi:hypothetical protein